MIGRPQPTAWQELTGEAFAVMLRARDVLDGDAYRMFMSAMLERVLLEHARLLDGEKIRGGDQ